jgi:nicotinamide riboside transporter PnuC
MDRGIAGVMAAFLATKGAAWGLAIGVILHFLLAFTFVRVKEKN